MVEKIYYFYLLTFLIVRISKQREIYFIFHTYSNLLDSLDRSNTKITYGIEYEYLQTTISKCEISQLARNNDEETFCFGIVVRKSNGILFKMPGKLILIPDITNSNTRIIHSIENIFFKPSNGPFCSLTGSTVLSLRHCKKLEDFLLNKATFSKRSSRTANGKYSIKAKKNMIVDSYYYDKERQLFISLIIQNVIAVDDQSIFHFNQELINNNGGLVVWIVDSQKQQLLNSLSIDSGTERTSNKATINGYYAIFKNETNNSETEIFYLEGISNIRILEESEVNQIEINKKFVVDNDITLKYYVVQHVLIANNRFIYKTVEFHSQYQILFINVPYHQFWIRINDLLRINKAVIQLLDIYNSSIICSINVIGLTDGIYCFGYFKISLNGIIFLKRAILSFEFKLRYGRIRIDCTIFDNFNNFYSLSNSELDFMKCTTIMTLYCPIIKRCLLSFQQCNALSLAPAHQPTSLFGRTYDRINGKHVVFVKKQEYVLTIRHVISRNTFTIINPSVDEVNDILQLTFDDYLAIDSDIKVYIIIDINYAQLMVSLSRHSFVYLPFNAVSNPFILVIESGVSESLYFIDNL